MGSSPIGAEDEKALVRYMKKELTEVGAHDVGTNIAEAVYYYRNSWHCKS